MTNGGIDWKSSTRRGVVAPLGGATLQCLRRMIWLSIRSRTLPLDPRYGITGVVAARGETFVHPRLNALFQNRDVFKVSVSSRNGEVVVPFAQSILQWIAAEESAYAQGKQGSFTFQAWSESSRYSATASPPRSA